MLTAIGYANLITANSTSSNAPTITVIVESPKNEAALLENSEENANRLAQRASEMKSRLSKHPVFLQAAELLANPVKPVTSLVC